METMDFWIDDDCEDNTFQSELDKIPISLQVDSFLEAALDCNVKGNGNERTMSPFLCKESIYKEEQPLSLPIPTLPIPTLNLQQTLQQPLPAQEKQKSEQDFLKLTFGSGPKKRYVFGNNGIYLESDSKTTNFVEPKAKKLKLLSKLLDSGLYKKIDHVHTIQHTQPKNINKSKWTSEEDEQLKQIMASSSSSNTPFSFSRVCSSMRTRTPKQCRERWHNQLSPDVRKDKWTKEEDETIIKCWKDFGPLWSRMALLLKGRTDNAIKNHFNCTLKKESALSSPLQN